MWLKKIYLQLYNESEHDEFKKPIGPSPVEALQAFGGRVEKWKNLGFSCKLIILFKSEDLQFIYNIF